MIPRADIIEWRSSGHPWKTDSQVEQDLILSRMLVELFRDSTLAGKLIFRGGTALHKLVLPRPIRYSEDLDFVQSMPGPIGQIFDEIRTIFDKWLRIPGTQYLIPSGFRGEYRAQATNYCPRNLFRPPPVYLSAVALA